MKAVILTGSVIFIALLTSVPFRATAKEDPKLKSATVNYPNLQELQKPIGAMPAILQRYEADLASLTHVYPLPNDPAKSTRLKLYYREWQDALLKLDFDGMIQDDKIDYLLFKNHLSYQVRRLDTQSKELEEQKPLIPFADKILELANLREKGAAINPSKMAAEITSLAKRIADIHKAVEAGLANNPPPATGKANDSNAMTPVKTTKKIAYRAEKSVRSLQRLMRDWYSFYNGYDPLFTWWMETPFKSVEQELQKYSAFLHEKAVGAAPGDDNVIIGDPIGSEALLNDLAYEMIPYKPEELIALANKEYAWCEIEMKRASREMGFGDDWKKALEKVKTDHVEPGNQVRVIRDLAEEATQFVEKHDLVTVPELARNGWRVEMMSPEAQQVNPFFLGGENIIVSFPTNSMTQEQKQMSLRGNNIHFARATVFHELIPGHHLQSYAEERFHPYRRLFNTPFWVEGWALHWEMLFWDMGFPKTPENRVGMLFWRMHRCARIIFSLNFHLGKMTPQECIDFLVDKVGHERANAEAEVRRSLNGSYPPLYQAAYMLGALQIRQLHKDLTDSGKMTNRAFHDAVLHENSIPIEMIRADLTNQKLTRDFESSWKFYENPQGNK